MDPAAKRAAADNRFPMRPLTLSAPETDSLWKEVECVGSRSAAAHRRAAVCGSERCVVELFLQSVCVGGACLH